MHNVLSARNSINYNHTRLSTHKTLIIFPKLESTLSFPDPKMAKLTNFGAKLWVISILNINSSFQKFAKDIKLISYVA